MVRAPSSGAACAVFWRYPAAPAARAAQLTAAAPLLSHRKSERRRDRQLYVNGDGSLKNGWNHITHNIIFNGPSDDRDLGNLYPAIDNDDGSQLCSFSFPSYWRHV